MQGAEHSWIGRLGPAARTNRGRRQLPAPPTRKIATLYTQVATRCIIEGRPSSNDIVLKGVPFRAINWLTMGNMNHLPNLPMPFPSRLDSITITQQKYGFPFG